MSKLKRLFFDLETSPNIGFFWRSGYKLNVGPESIIQERAIICACYKWEGEKTVHFLEWNKGDDKKLLQEFIKVVNEADEIVAHNGDKFDVKWLRTRCLRHRIPVFPFYKTVDTLKIAREQFYFNSNKLNYISQFLGIGKKHNTGYDLWKDIVLKNDEKSMKKMIAYCKQDVKLLEEVFNILQSYAIPKTHKGVVEGKGKLSCPYCASYQFVISKTRISARGYITKQLKCKSCGGYHTVSNATYEAQR